MSREIILVVDLDPTTNDAAGYHFEDQITGAKVSTEEAVAEGFSSVGQGSALFVQFCLENYFLAHKRARALLAARDAGLLTGNQN